MKKKILVGLLVFATLVGIAFAGNNAKKYYCAKGCGNQVTSEGAVCSDCQEKERREAEKKRAQEAARRYDAENDCKASSYYDDCMSGWGY